MILYVQETASSSAFATYRGLAWHETRWFAGAIFTFRCVAADAGVLELAYVVQNIVSCQVSCLIASLISISSWTCPCFTCCPTRRLLLWGYSLTNIFSHKHVNWMLADCDVLTCCREHILWQLCLHDVEEHGLAAHSLVLIRRKRVVRGDTFIKLHHIGCLDLFLMDLLQLSQALISQLLVTIVPLTDV